MHSTQLLLSDRRRRAGNRRSCPRRLWRCEARD